MIISRRVVGWASPVVILVMAGCGSVSPDNGKAAPSKSSASSNHVSGSAGPCVIAEVSAGPPATSKESTITVAKKLVISKQQVQSEDALKNAPAVPQIEWSSTGGADDSEVLSRLPASVQKAASIDKSPGIDRVTTFLSDLSRTDGTYVGYAAVRPVSVPLAVTCSGGRTLEGTLRSWSEPDIGAVKCGLRLDNAAPPVAGAAQRQHC